MERQKRLIDDYPEFRSYKREKPQRGCFKLMLIIASAIILAFMIIFGLKVGCAALVIHSLNKEFEESQTKTQKVKPVPKPTKPDNQTMKPKPPKVQKQKTEDIIYQDADGVWRNVSPVFKPESRPTD